MTPGTTIEIRTYITNSILKAMFYVTDTSIKVQELMISYMSSISASPWHVQNTIKGVTTAFKRSGFDTKPGILWCRDYHWDMFISQYLCFPLSDHSTISPYSHFTDLPSVKVNLERPLKFQEVEAPRISRQSTHEDYNAVSPTYRPPLPTWYSFLWEAK
jgi:hypothetical protein